MLPSQALQRFGGDLRCECFLGSGLSSHGHMAIPHKSPWATPLKPTAWAQRRLRQLVLCNEAPEEDDLDRRRFDTPQDVSAELHPYGTAKNAETWYQHPPVGVPCLEAFFSRVG